MRGIHGLSGWRYLFLIEGIITASVGVASSGLMPASICQTAGWLRGKKSWLSEREEKILVNRLLRDDPSKGDMSNRQAVDLRRLWSAVKDFDLWPLYLVGLTNYIPYVNPGLHLPSYQRHLLTLIHAGKDRNRRRITHPTSCAKWASAPSTPNLLTIPSQFLFGVNGRIHQSTLLPLNNSTTYSRTLPSS
jgi:hypothetical protein